MTTRAASVRIARNLRPLLERMCDGYSVDWNGRDLLGVLSADGLAAAEDVGAHLTQMLHPES